MIQTLIIKKMMKLLIAAGLTIVLIVANTKDNTAAKVRNFDLSRFFNVESVQVLSQNFDDNRFRNEIAPTSDDSEKHSESFLLKGTASHYADKFHGKLTANGEVFNMNGFTCAHKKLPFGTVLKITNTENNRTTLVRVTDRGPYVGDRIIDLSFGAAKWIGNTALPKIKAEGFDSRKFKDEIQSGIENRKEVFFAYSEDNDLKIVDSDSFEIKFTGKDFSTAVRKYRELKSKSNINNVFLLVKADEMKVKYGKKGVFHVGQIKAENLLAYK
jgi:rare lipoprotein A